MLDKIKSVIQIKEELDSINKKVDSQTSSLQAMEERSLQIHKLLGQFKTQQESIVSEQKRIIHDFQKDKLSLSEQVEELKKEIFNFKALKGNVQNDILKKFEEELKQALIFHTEELQKETANYKNITSEIQKTAGQLSSLHDSIAKLQEIAGAIKKEDFQLNKTLHHVQAMERDNKSLLERLDKAERFAASMRRKNP